VALAFFVVFWMAYDSICQLFGRRKHGDTIVGIGVALLVCFAAWLACHWFAGRAAFILVGAMMATTMSGNVFFWIIPGQRKNVAALREGRPVDPVHGQRGKQRSVHNTYFTLPVIFTMMSNHYSFTYTHEHNWIVLLLIMAAGAAIRQFFVVRHRYKLGLAKNPLPYALVGLAILVGTIVWMKPAPQPAQPQAAAPQAVTFAELRGVLEQRCYQCHGAQVQMKNVRLDLPEGVRQHAQGIYQQVVVTKIMPMGNATHMTDAERALVGRWFQAGAQLP